jgi:hypothetical protein
MITVIGEFQVMVDNVAVDILETAKRTFVERYEFLFVLEP